MSGDEPVMESSHSVTRWIDQLKEEDPEAAGHLWERFFNRLLPVARARMRGLNDRTVNEEDILVSVFDRLFKNAAADRFAKLQDRDDLWQILLTLTKRRVNRQYRHARALKRGGDGVQRLDDIAQPGQDLKELADSGSDPQIFANLSDRLTLGLQKLDDKRTQEIALRRLEGYSNQEIADRLHVSLATVERKLRRIREVWTELLLTDDRQDAE